MGTAIESQGAHLHCEPICTTEKAALDHEINSLYSAVSDIEAVIYRLTTLVTLPQTKPTECPSPARSGLAPAAILDARQNLQALTKKLDILTDELAKVIGEYKLLDSK